MRYKKGWKFLIPFILTGMIALTGCADEEAPGGVSDVSGALFLSENEENTESAASKETAAEDIKTTAYEVSEISAAAEDASAVPQARKLSDKECEKIQSFINETGSYGFLLSVYEDPRDLDAEQVFYVGAGLETELLSEEEREAYLEETGEEEAANVFRLSTQQINDFLQYRAGISIDDLTRKPGWVYLEEYDAYYISHGDEDTNICKFEVTDAAEQGDYLRVHFRTKRNPKRADGWHLPVYEAILKKNGDSYRFCSNRLWMEKDLLLLPYRQIELESGGKVSLCAYRPDESTAENADVTLSVVGDGDVKYNLPGMNAQNVRSNMYFEEVRAVDYGDYDGDGSKEIVAVMRYTASGESKARKDGLEARIYRFGENGEPELDQKLSKTVTAKVSELSLSGIAHYLKSGKDREPFKNWKEAYIAEVEEADPDSFNKFALIYIDDDRVPELLEMGATPEKGAKIVFFREGVMEETVVSSNFSYLRKENLLYSKTGTGLVFTDSIYVYTGNGFEVYQSGTYGTMDAAVTAYTKDKKPEYSYIWEKSAVSEAGYRDALGFIYASQRAVDASAVTMATAQEFTGELGKQ